jgi:hypothetical protein
VEDTDLGKDIEIQKFPRHFIISEGVGYVWRFRIVLTSGVFVEIIEPARTPESAPCSNYQDTPVYVRKTAMR